jgi:hypothetical protein
LAIAGSALGKPPDQPPKVYPRQPIPGLTPTDVIPAAVIPVPEDPLKKCRRQRKEGFSECQRDYASDPETRAACLASEVKVFADCVAAIAKPGGGIDFDADLLQMGLAVMYGPAGSHVTLWACNEAGEWHEFVASEDAPGMYSVPEVFGGVDILIAETVDQDAWFDMATLE